jgi:2-hydroxychromene-2-carboxylate isomerase
MTLSCAIDESSLSVLLDIRYPQAYLALHSAIRLGSELRIGINWLPLVVPPLTAPSTPRPDDDRGIRHRRSRAEAIAREIDTYAGAQGLVLRDYYRDLDPAAVNLGWLWVRHRHTERLQAFLAEAFRAYWALEFDPSDEAAVAALVESLGCDAPGFRSWCAVDGPVAAAALADELRGRGLFGVPGYVVEGEFFLGRQHLPMIRWMLEGRSGPVPI